MSPNAKKHFEKKLHTYIVYLGCFQKNIPLKEHRIGFSFSLCYCYWASSFTFAPKKPTQASVVQLVRTSPIMRVVMSLNPDWHENFLIFHITLLSDCRGMAKWFGAHYNEEVRFRSAVKGMNGSLVLTSLLNQRRSYYYYFLIFS